MSVNLDTSYNSTIRIWN